MMFTLWKTMKNHSLRPRQSAFTLIEVLVVIAICALLVAILFPVIMNTREKARGVACLSNYHQIAAGVQMYASDYDSSTPPDGGSFSGIIKDCEPYIKESSVFTCPDDFDRVREERPGSYRMPALYQGKSISCGWPDPYAAGAKQTLTKPSTTTLMYEAEQDFSQAPVFPTFRHNGGTQTLFFDGHAKWIKGVGSKDDVD